MKNLIIASLAAMGLALGTAATASASEQAFIEAIDSLGYYAIGCPGCDQDVLDTGYEVCAAFDVSEQAAIQHVLDTYNGPGQANPGYYANLFAQYSAYELCPQHNGKIGPI